MGHRRYSPNVASAQSLAKLYAPRSRLTKLWYRNMIIFQCHNKNIVEPTHRVGLHSYHAHFSPTWKNEILKMLHSSICEKPRRTIFCERHHTIHIKPLVLQWCHTHWNSSKQIYSSAHMELHNAGVHLLNLGDKATYTKHRNTHEQKSIGNANDVRASARQAVAHARRSTSPPIYVCNPNTTHIMKTNLQTNLSKWFFSNAWPIVIKRRKAKTFLSLPILWTWATKVSAANIKL